MKTDKKKKLTKTDIRECLWFWFGKLFIRLRDTNSQGYGYCISSGKKLYWTEGQAGHFIPAGSCEFLRYVEDNVNLQSFQDNVFKHSNVLRYEDELIKKIGKDKVEYLKGAKNEIGNSSILLLKEKIQEYRTKVMEIVDKKNKKVQKEIMEYIKKKDKKKRQSLYETEILLN